MSVTAIHIESHKGSGGVSPVFPDTCLIPAPPAPPVPAPYASLVPPVRKAAVAPGSKAPVAAAAAASPVYKQTTGLIANAKSQGFTLMGMPGVQFEGASVLMFGSPAFSNAAPPDARDAAARLRQEMTRVHGQLLSLPPANPGKWHDLLDSYAMLTARLYVALHLK
jgi:hypothetical protein